MNSSKPQLVRNHFHYYYYYIISQAEIEHLYVTLISIFVSETIRNWMEFIEYVMPCRSWCPRNLFQYSLLQSWNATCAPTQFRNDKRRQIMEIFTRTRARLINSNSADEIGKIAILPFYVAGTGIDEDYARVHRRDRGHMHDWIQHSLGAHRRLSLVRTAKQRETRKIHSVSFGLCVEERWYLAINVARWIFAIENYAPNCKWAIEIHTCGADRQTADR